MPLVEVTSNKLVLDGIDVAPSVLAYSLEAVGRDIPTLMLHLKPDADGTLFEGYANVKIASEGPSLMEFLSALDPQEVERLVMETGDMSENLIVGVLRVLLQLANKVSPGG